MRSGAVYDADASSEFYYHLPTAEERLEAEKRILSYKDFKGFKRIENNHSITDRYRMGEALGKGSFGEVRRAEHILANVDCAVKIIMKNRIEKHQILVDLMHNELKVLESTVTILISNNYIYRLIQIL
jgi:serine/threonine protein kinase